MRLLSRLAAACGAAHQCDSHQGGKKPRIQPRAYLLPTYDCHIINRSFFFSLPDSGCYQGAALPAHPPPLSAVHTYGGAWVACCTCTHSIPPTRNNRKPAAATVWCCRLVRRIACWLTSEAYNHLVLQPRSSRPPTRRPPPPLLLVGSPLSPSPPDRPHSARPLLARLYILFPRTWRVLDGTSHHHQFPSNAARGVLSPLLKAFSRAGAPPVLRDRDGLYAADAPWHFLPTLRGHVLANHFSPRHNVARIIRTEAQHHSRESRRRHVPTGHPGSTPTTWKRPDGHAVRLAVRRHTVGGLQRFLGRF